MPKKAKKQEKLRIIPLGGINEIGKNLTVLEYGNDMIMIDCGMGFPDDAMPGVDYIIPDFSYIEKNSEKLKGIFITHGHEDHIGAVTTLPESLSSPIFATKLSVGILKNKFKELPSKKPPELVDIEAGDTVKVGNFAVEFIRVNHSIADSCALAITTPVGTVIHSGDFKLDLTPVDGEVMDLPRFAEIGKKGVLLFMCESTNVEKSGFTPSEKTVGETFDDIFERHNKERLVIATFSSNVHRVQQIIDKSVAHGRKVAITGRSMINVLTAAHDLGYINYPEKAVIDINEVKRYKPEQLTIICTGSQGERMSGLYRMAYGEHDKIKLGNDDLVIISSHPIPGNEKLVNNVVNELCHRGIRVYRDTTSDVHVSGHACRDEIKLLHSLVRPKFFMPVHGEAMHLKSHKELAVEMGMEPCNIFIPELGRVLELTGNSASWGETVPSGSVMVDGSGVGDVGSAVLRERLLLSQDGLIIIAASINSYDYTISSGPDIISRGFVYVRESEDLINDLRSIAYDTLSDTLGSGRYDLSSAKGRVRDEIAKHIWKSTRRKPMIIPIIMTV